MKLTITQTDNGWVLEYLGYDCLHKQKVFTKWTSVEKALREYFGFYGINNKKTMVPTEEE